MREQFRKPSERQAEQDVLKAMDHLEAKKMAGLWTARERAAFDRLESALIYAREVELAWGEKSRGLINEARDLLRTDLKDANRPLDLHHCEKALQALEKTSFLDRVKEQVKKAKERAAKAKDREESRERD